MNQRDFEYLQGSLSNMFDSIIRGKMAAEKREQRNLNAKLQNEMLALQKEREAHRLAAEKAAGERWEKQFSEGKYRDLRNTGRELEQENNAFLRQVADDRERLAQTEAANRYRDQELAIRRDALQRPATGRVKITGPEGEQIDVPLSPEQLAQMQKSVLKSQETPHESPYNKQILSLEETIAENQAQRAMGDERTGFLNWKSRDAEINSAQANLRKLRELEQQDLAERGTGAGGLPREQLIEAVRSGRMSKEEAKARARELGLQ